MSNRLIHTHEELRQHMNWSVDFALRSASAQMKLPEAWVAEQQDLAGAMHRLSPQLGNLWDLFNHATRAWVDHVAQNERGELKLSTNEEQIRYAKLHAELNTARENFIKGMTSEVWRIHSN